MVCSLLERNAHSISAEAELKSAIAIQGSDGDDSWSRQPEVLTQKSPVRMFPLAVRSDWASSLLLSDARGGLCGLGN